MKTAEPKNALLVYKQRALPYLEYCNFLLDAFSKEELKKPKTLK